MYTLSKKQINTRETDDQYLTKRTKQSRSNSPTSPLLLGMFAASHGKLSEADINKLKKDHSVQHIV